MPFISFSDTEEQLINHTYNPNNKKDLIFIEILGLMTLFHFIFCVELPTKDEYQPRYSLPQSKFLEN